MVKQVPIKEGREYVFCSLFKYKTNYSSFGSKMSGGAKLQIMTNVSSWLKKKEPPSTSKYMKKVILPICWGLFKLKL